jgi:hypothetical protein
MLALWAPQADWGELLDPRALAQMAHILTAHIIVELVFRVNDNCHIAHETTLLFPGGDGQGGVSGTAKLRIKT